MSTAKRYKDALIGAAAIVIAIFYYRGSFFETRNLMQADFGPEFMPRIYSVGLVILGLTMIVMNLHRVKKAGAEQAEAESATSARTALLKILATVALIVVYVCMIKPVGFLLSTFAYMTLQLCVITPKPDSKPVRFLIFSAVSAIFLDFVFVRFFSLSLPTGLLGF